MSTKVFFLTLKSQKEMKRNKQRAFSPFGTSSAVVLLSLLLLFHFAVGEEGKERGEEKKERGRERKVFVEGFIEERVPTLYVKEEFMREIQLLPCHNGTLLSLSSSSPPSSPLLSVSLLVRLSLLPSALHDEVICQGERCGEDLRKGSAGGEERCGEGEGEEEGKRIKLSRGAGEYLGVKEGEEMIVTISPSLILLSPSEVEGKVEEMDIFTRNYKLKVNAYCQSPLSLSPSFSSSIYNNGAEVKEISSNSLAKSSIHFPAYAQLIGLIPSSSDLIILNYYQLSSLSLSPPYPFLEISSFSFPFHNFPSLSSPLNSSSQSSPLSSPPSSIPSSPPSPLPSSLPAKGISKGIKRGGISDGKGIWEGKVVSEYGKVVLFGSPTINGSNFNVSLGERYKEEMEMVKELSERYANQSRSILSKPSSKRSVNDEEHLVISYHCRDDYSYGELSFLPSNSVFLTSSLASKLSLSVGDFLLLKSSISHETFLLKQQLKLLQTKP